MRGTVVVQSGSSWQNNSPLMGDVRSHKSNMKQDMNKGHMYSNGALGWEFVLDSLPFLTLGAPI